MSDADSVDELKQLEEELDERVKSLPLASVSVRALLATTHQLLDTCMHGNRVAGGSPDLQRAEALGGRLFGLGPLLRECPPELGGTIADAFNEYAGVDPDGAHLRLVLGYGHLWELMPEVRQGRWEVSGDRASGFQLSHPDGWADFEARDFLLLQLVAASPPPEAPVEEHDIGTIARAAPELESVDDLVSPLIAALKEYYARFLNEERLLSDDAFRSAVGYSRAEWLAVRGALWANAVFASAIAGDLFAAHRRGEIDEHRLWEAYEWISMCWRWDRFIGLVARVSGLPSDTVEGVLRPFVLDLRPGHEAGVIRDGYLPPIARVENAAVTSPAFIKLFTLERNILFVLKEVDEQHFNNVISQHLEPTLVADAAEAFGVVDSWDSVSNVEWSDGEIDLLVYSQNENVALQVQAKATLAPQGARMVRMIEDSARNGVDQLARFRALHQEQRDAIVSGAFNRQVANVQLVNVLLTRSSFGSARAWEHAGDVGMVNLGLLRLVLRRAVAEERFPPPLSEVPALAKSLLDEFVAAAQPHWTLRTTELGDSRIEVPMLDFNPGVVAGFRRLCMP